MPTSRATNGALLGTLPWTVLALAVAAGPHVPYLPVWVTIALVAASAWRYLIERRRGLLPHVLVRGSLALACFLAILATYHTISGVGPGSALLAVMGAMKLLETRRRRDQYVLLFIALFLTMSALLREQYLWSLPYLLVSLLVAMTAWLRLTSTSSESATASLKTCGRLIGYAAPIAVAMWILFPRISAPFWSVPIDTGSAVTGLSDNMSPGDISSLSQSNAVAFRVRFTGAVPPPSERYWRGIVLTQFNGRSWELVDGWDNGNEPGALERIRAFGEPYVYDLTLEPTGQRYALALDVPYRWDNLSDSYMTRHQQLVREFPIDTRVQYQVVSFPDYRLDLSLRDNARQRYAREPDGNPETVEFARDLRAQSDDDRDFVRRVLTKFSDEAYYYTLQPPALGRNPVDQFLFDSRRGFCEHYASAFAVMMRAADIPARIVLGYQGGEINGDYLTVRQADAHAWTEIWLEGSGWVRIDPTAAVAPERIESGRVGALFEGLGAEWGMAAPSQFLYQLSQSWDRLNARWNDWVLGFGPDKQKSLMERLGMDDPDWQTLMLTLVASVAILVGGISILMVLRNRAPTRDRAFRLYRRFVRSTGLAPQTGEAPEAFARRAIASGAAPGRVQQVTKLYLHARYGNADAQSLRALETAVRAKSARQG